MCNRLASIGLCALSIVLLIPLGCVRETPKPVITRLDDAKATRLADSIRQSVSVELAEGLELSLWAPDELVKDPVALDIDQQGRVYITRTNRQKNSEFDIRGHMDWAIASISFQSVEDRRAFLRTELAPERSAENTWLANLNGDSLHDWRDLLVEKEQVYRIEDESGDGRADMSQLYVEDFHEEITDVAGAVLAYGDDVYLGVGPDLWRLRDTRGDGMADEKKSISHGYAVHIGFGGHGMSGLIVGPDGRIYWGIGDIGLNVVDPDGRHWEYPNQGAIVRANPDGSDFEVFAAGLRNTHEFEFDEYGNLISVDNDGDHAGETERLVYVVNGSDSGWRINWQFGKYTDPDNNTYKVWMDEGLFKPRFEGQAAYITPPVASYHSGPAGMTYNAGTALSDAWKDHFFVSEFVGSPTRSRILAFRIKPKGATFEFVDEKVVVQGILTTGLEFGPDGALYLGDWIDGWDAKNKGRIWKVDVPGGAESDVRREVKELLSAGFAQRTVEELQRLIRHTDMRVRLGAQFALVKKGAAGLETLLAAARQTEHQLARIHGLWGIGQRVREATAPGSLLTPFLQDADPEMRAQAAKVIGDVRYADEAEALVPLLTDEAARPRFFGAEALGRIRYPGSVQPIIAMLEANDDQDAYLRHAGALALARIGDADAVVALAGHPSRAVRIAAVVALRRTRHPSVARFLNDADEYIVTEAARAINDDRSIEEALPELADVLDDVRFSNEALLRRAVNAALRVGTAKAAEGVAAFAARTSAPEAMRAEAVLALGVWPKPSVVDRVDGTYRGVEERDPAIARQVIAPIIESLLTRASPMIKTAAAETAGRLAYEPAAPLLFALVRRDASPDVRVAALEALPKSGFDRMAEALEIALADRFKIVRAKAIALIPSLDLPDDRAAKLLASVLGKRSFEEQQQALSALGRVKSASAHAVLERTLDQLIAGTLPAELHLDVIEAVEANNSEPLRMRVAEYLASLSAADAVGTYRVALSGGDPIEGRRLFFQHESAQCVRCHAISGLGGDVAPDLMRTGAELTRMELLESLVVPDVRIAPGYGTVSLTLTDGQIVQGALRSETDREVVVDVAGGGTMKVPKDSVAQRQDAPSSMPPMAAFMTRREIRDMVAFMETLR